MKPFRINLDDFVKKEDYLWEIPLGYRNGMKVPARVFALEDQLPSLLRDRSVQQLINVTHLPGIVGAALVMPDAHEGYGFPIGGVAATLHPSGVISPGGIGYDINCGVRLLVTELRRPDILGREERLASELYAEIPSGMGVGGSILLSSAQMDEVLTHGARWAMEHGYGSESELPYMESHGCLEDADPDRVSARAKQRGRDQLGTLGAGNHFVELDTISTLFDTDTARAYGLEEDQLVFLIHTGSRGLGHQVATDHIRVMMKAMPAYGVSLPDRELACVPFDSKEGQDYYKAMCAAANFAWCNREIISWEIRKAWGNVLGSMGGKLRLLYDVAHNIAKVEDHKWDGSQYKLIVHRKGATRAFGPGFDELPPEYRQAGQPVLIPGSMGTCSYVLAGRADSRNISFGSSCHGAGRRMSRRAAKKEVNAPQLQSELLQQGIRIKAGSLRGIAEEAPVAYKDVNSVVETVHLAGIASKVACLEPVIVIKG